MSENKPVPETRQPVGKACPVCGHTTYSKGGIHPQCAVLQAHEDWAKRQKAEAKSEANAADESTWTKKKCPNCGSKIHARRKACDCGHVFF